MSAEFLRLASTDGAFLVRQLGSETRAAERRQDEPASRRRSNVSIAVASAVPNTAYMLKYFKNFSIIPQTQSGGPHSMELSMLAAK